MWLSLIFFFSWGRRRPKMLNQLLFWRPPKEYWSGGEGGRLTSKKGWTRGGQCCYHRLAWKRRASELSASWRGRPSIYSLPNSWWFGTETARPVHCVLLAFCSFFFYTCIHFELSIEGTSDFSRSSIFYFVTFYDLSNFFFRLTPISHWLRVKVFQSLQSSGIKEKKKKNERVCPYKYKKPANR